MAANVRPDGAHPEARGRTPLACCRFCVISAALSLLAGVTLAIAQRPTPPGQQITVRFLEPPTGKPIRKMWVGVTQWKDEPPKEQSNVPYILASTNARTNGNGEVVFTLADPRPKYISVQSFDLWYSGSLVPTSEVLNSGVVFDYSNAKPPRGHWVNKQGQPVMKSGSLLPDGKEPKKGRAKLNVIARPGEIIFIEKKITKWEWFLQELP